MKLSLHVKGSLLPLDLPLRVADRHMFLLLLMRFEILSFKTERQLSGVIKQGSQCVRACMRVCVRVCVCLEACQHSHSDVTHVVRARACVRVCGIVCACHGRVHGPPHHQA